MKDGSLLFPGKVGANVSVEQAQQAACQSVLNILGAVEFYLKDVNNIKGIIKMTGYVAAAPGFNKMGLVTNAASQLLIDILGGQKGEHTRTTVGVSELPADSSVEIDLILEI